MTKVVDYLEKIYDSGGTSVYIYIVVGGVALILILLLLLSFINKKDKATGENPEESKKEKKHKKNKENNEDKLPVDTLKEEPISLEQPIEEKDDFSSVYVDVPNKESEVESNIKEEKEIIEPIIEEPEKEEPVQNSEILVPDMEIKPSVKEFEEPKILEDFAPIKEEPVIDKTPEVIAPPEIEEVKVEKDFSEKPLNTFDIKQETIKEEPLVLEPDDIKSKLENISSNKDKAYESSLDDLLKQMGVDASPEITGNKDEEDILLGK